MHPEYKLLQPARPEKLIGQSTTGNNLRQVDENFLAVFKKVYNSQNPDHRDFYIGLIDLYQTQTEIYDKIALLEQQFKGFMRNSHPQSPIQFQYFEQTIENYEAQILEAKQKLHRSNENLDQHYRAFFNL